MPIYTFHCEDGHRFDSRAGYDVTSTYCQCGKSASREGVYRINYGGFASTSIGQQDFVQDYRRYREASEQIDDVVSRREADIGHEIAVPLYKTAKEQFTRLHALGVTADDITT